MIKFDVTNRFTGAVQFTAEIDCAESEKVGIKLGLAVKWAINTRVSLADANLADANLAGAILADAILAGANLADANLAGAKWANGAAITRAPLQLFGLDYPVTIVDAHMQIGCELHSLAEWEAFDDERISRMDGKRARRFWDAHRDTLLALARADARSFAAELVDTRP